MHPSVEALARSMCAALEIDPDEHFRHGVDYDPYPKIDRRPDGGAATIDILMYSPNWHRFAWSAHKWIFENSGGELPRPERHGGSIE